MGKRANGQTGKRAHGHMGMGLLCMVAPLVVQDQMLERLPDQALALARLAAIGSGPFVTGPDT